MISGLPGKELLCARFSMGLAQGTSLFFIAPDLQWDGVKPSNFIYLALSKRPDLPAKTAVVSKSLSTFLLVIPPAEEELPIEF